MSRHYLTDVIVFIGIKRHLITDIFQYQSQSVYTDNITMWKQRENVKLVDKIVWRKMSNFPATSWREHVTSWREHATSWREHVTFGWDDNDDVRFVLDQHAYAYFYNAETTVGWHRTHYSEPNSLSPAAYVVLRA
jgi:hypothetical protein